MSLFISLSSMEDVQIGKHIRLRLVRNSGRPDKLQIDAPADVEIRFPRKPPRLPVNRPLRARNGRVQP